MQDTSLLAELRKVRAEMLADFPTDVALFQAIKAAEAEHIRQGRTLVSLPPRRPQDTNTNAA